MLFRHALECCVGDVVQVSNYMCLRIQLAFSDVHGGGGRLEREERVADWLFGSLLSLRDCEHCENRITEEACVHFVTANVLAQLHEWS